MSAYHRPTTLQEAVAIYGANPELVVVAGATDVYPALTQRAAWGDPRRPDVLDISGIAEIRGIRDRGDHWWIGAATTWQEIADADLPPLFDGLKAAAREIGGVQIQARGTIGGNIVTASPAGDSIPCLLALDADVEVASGVLFRVPLEKFVTGYRATALGAGEIVAGLRITKSGGHGAFAKLGARRYLVISIAMVAGVFDLDDRGIIRSARIAVGACSAIAQRLPALEAALAGRRPDARLVRPEHFDHLTPLDDVRASADYRRAAALKLTTDLVSGLVSDSGRLAS